MEVLLRERTRAGDRRDREFTGRTVTIGSAPDQAIQLPGTVLRHARISGAGNALRIVCVGRQRVRVNGAVTRGAELSVGDRIEIAGHELHVIDPPAGFHAGIEVSPIPDVPAAALEPPLPMRLEETLVGKRSVAWVLLVVVLLGGLVVPLYVTQRDGEEHNVPIVAFDRLWSTGPLLPAHDLAIGDDCSACHVELFQRVQDRQCTACHATVAQHVSPEIEATVEVERCAVCHKEHNDPRYFVVRRDEFCTDCHATPQQLPAASVSLEPVLGFGADVHPPFDVHLLVPRAEQLGNLLSTVWEDRIESPVNAEEQSNLKFPHDVHLDPTKVLRLRDSSSLECGDCHVLSTDREHFLPVEMERHCRDCHDLTFDPANPVRQLPHGQPQEAIFAIEGYFFTKFGNADERASTAPRRRVPWTRPDGACTDDPTACALAQIEQEIVNQFSRRGCVTCHFVEDNQDENPSQRFQVHPVRLQVDYHPRSTFPHDKHLTQGDLTGEAACSTCHSALTSTASSQLLVPGIDTCLDCHGDTSSRDKVRLNCVSCHSYHPQRRANVAYPIR